MVSVDTFFQRQNILSHSACFISELMEGGNLKAFIEKSGKLSLSEIKKLSKDIAWGLSYLHSLNPKVVHLDLKPGTTTIIMTIMDNAIPREYTFGCK